MNNGLYGCRNAGDSFFCHECDTMPISNPIFKKTRVRTVCQTRWSSIPLEKRRDTYNGGVVASIAMVMKLPLFLPIVGIVYLVEALSVVLQVGYYRYTGGKRLFRMAPLHHHLEQCGWSETGIVVSFSIVTTLFCLLALAGQS